MCCADGASLCGKSYERATGMTELGKGGFVLTVCKLPTGHLGNHYHKSTRFNREAAIKNVAAKLAEGKCVSKQCVKLSEERVKEIRKLGATGEYFITELASMYGVSENAMRSLLYKKTWRDVGGPDVKLKNGGIGSFGNGRKKKR